MKRLATLVLSLAAMAALPPAAPASAAPSDTADVLKSTAKPDRVYCLAGWESFLPGDYYACRALYHLQRHHPTQAVEMLKQAAYWANKDAQHALGLVYVNGDAAGFPANRAMGIAWLALAAERKEPDYVRDYTRAVLASSPEQVARAGKIYQRLRKDYGDQAAGPRAVHRFIRRIKPLDDAAAMGGNFAWIQGLSPVPQGAMVLARKIHAQADQDFDGLQGTVTVGALERVAAPSPSLRQRYATPPATQDAAKQPR